MSRIRILPENLANQIAAGEVIERPASVVKELVENAIDAGATAISVQVEGNGSRLIRVLDNGLGMDSDDVLLCLERHATSKIASLAELEGISSLGFRGEAVPSIASVSRLRILSRPPADPLGTQAEVRFGRLHKVHEMGCPPGTSFEVSDLFGNVPARRKFLKSARTELAHIEEVVRCCALARPGLALRYSVDGREVLRLEEGGSERERVARLLSRPAEKLVGVGEWPQEGGEEAAGGVSGFLLPPDDAGAARLRLFVNGRSIQDRMLAHAVNEGMQGWLMKGRRPAGGLFLRVAPESVDVNVHPTKQEVRFRRPEALHQEVVQAVRAAMLRHQQKLREDIFVLPAAPHTGSHAQEEGDRRPVFREAAVPFRSGLFAAEGTPRFEPPGPERPRPPAGPGGPLSGIAPRQEVPLSLRPPPRAAENGSGQGILYLGQVLRTYLLCAGDEGLLVIDQHAAHERLLFETLLRQFATRSVARQVLLFPKVVECTLEEARVLRDHAGEIAALGLDIQEFGGESYVVKAVPALLGRSPVEEILSGVFARFCREGGGARAEEVLADMACKAAIKAGQALDVAEAEALIVDMQRAAVFSHCPHGRPVARLFAAPDLEKWFHRG